MRSRIFRGRLFHHRLAPVSHEFTYPVSFVGIDLEELAELDRSVALFGYNRRRILSLHDRDYLDGEPGSIGERARAWLRKGGCRRQVERIVLLTTPRHFGYVFNPVSFYLCFDRDDTMVAAIADVNNTFGDRHLYVLPELQRKGAAGYWFAATRKDFHVSPFFSVEGEYQFFLRDHGNRVDLSINLLRDGKAVFLADLRGEADQLDSSTIMKSLLRSTTSAATTMPRIMVQAAKLHYRKKLRAVRRRQPVSSSTVVTRPVSLVDRFARDKVLAMLERIRVGRLLVELPDGETHDFGESRSSAVCNLRVRDYRFFRRIVLGGEIGFGESYMDGDFETRDLPGVISLILANRDHLVDRSPGVAWLSRLADKGRHALRRNTIANSRRNIREHYDLSNEFYKLFLGDSMMYSAGIHTAGSTLEQAQLAKMDRLLEKARIGCDHHVLEIGAGWGGFAIHMAQSTGCRVTSVTVSEAQWRYARDRVRALKLEDRVSIELCDYRKLRGKFDRIVSIEMLEAVGHEYLPEFFSQCDRLLKPDGLMVLQVITMPDSRYERYRKGVDWIRKHIFPGGHLPSLAAMNEAMQRSAFHVEDLENIGAHYADTLRMWRERFVAREREVAALGFDPSFIRKWEYYFSYCEAAFATRTLNDLHLVVSRTGNPSLDQQTVRLAGRDATRDESKERRSATDDVDVDMSRPSTRRAMSTV